MRTRLWIATAAAGLGAVVAAMVLPTELLRRSEAREAPVPEQPRVVMVTTARFQPDRYVRHLPGTIAARSEADLGFPGRRQAARPPGSRRRPRAGGRRRRDARRDRPAVAARGRRGRAGRGEDRARQGRDQPGAGDQARIEGLGERPGLRRRDGRGRGGAGAAAAGGAQRGLSAQPARLRDATRRQPTG